MKAMIPLGNITVTAIKGKLPSFSHAVRDVIQIYQDMDGDSCTQVERFDMSHLDETEIEALKQELYTVVPDEAPAFIEHMKRDNWSGSFLVDYY